MPRGDPRGRLTEVGYLVLLVSNILVICLGGLFTLGVLLWGVTVWKHLWYGPALMILATLAARTRSDQLALGRERLGFGLMLLPVIAGGVIVTFYALSLTAGARAYDALPGA